MKLIWLLGILTFGGLYLSMGSVFLAVVTFIPTFVIVLILYLGAIQFANEVIQPIWKWLVK